MNLKSFWLGAILTPLSVLLALKVSDYASLLQLSLFAVSAIMYISFLFNSFKNLSFLKAFGISILFFISFVIILSICLFPFQTQFNIGMLLFFFFEPWFIIGPLALSIITVILKKPLEEWVEATSSRAALLIPYSLLSGIVSYMIIFPFMVFVSAPFYPNNFSIVISDSLARTSMFSGIMFVSVLIITLIIISIPTKVRLYLCKKTFFTSVFSLSIITYLFVWGQAILAKTLGSPNILDYSQAIALLFATLFCIYSAIIIVRKCTITSVSEQR